MQLGAPEGEETWHLLAARGSNPMGLVLSSSGEHTHDIYDGLLRDKGQSYSVPTPLAEALHGLWPFARDGQSLLDIRDKALKRDPKGFPWLATTL